MIELFSVAASMGVPSSGRHVAAIGSRLAADVVIAFHYLHRRPSISHAFGLFGDGDLRGVVTFGVPPSRHLQVSACRANPDAVIELNRLWVADTEAHGTESWFVARALRMLPALIVVSYADTAQGHVGYVYRALSFRYAGLTDADRKTPRYDYIPLSGGHTRDASRSGTARKVRRLPKHRYWTTTGSPSERRRLAAACTWPSQSWRDQ